MNGSYVGSWYGSWYIFIYISDYILKYTYIIPYCKKVFIRLAKFSFWIGRMKTLVPSFKSRIQNENFAFPSVTINRKVLILSQDKDRKMKT